MKLAVDLACSVRLAARESLAFYLCFSSGRFALPAGKGPDTGERRKREENKREKEGKGKSARLQFIRATNQEREEAFVSRLFHAAPVFLFIPMQRRESCRESAPTDNNFSLREVNRARRVVKRKFRCRPFFFVQQSSPIGETQLTACNFFQIFPRLPISIQN